MAQDETSRPAEDADGKASAQLSQPERQAVRRSQSSTARAVHEAVRLSGVDEMRRPAVSLALSGLAAGLVISSSLMAQAAIASEVGVTGLGALAGALGYSVGFVVVIMGRMQLFTENTVIPVLVVAQSPTLANFGRLLRLKSMRTWLCWGICCRRWRAISWADPCCLPCWRTGRFRANWADGAQPRPR